MKKAKAGDVTAKVTLTPTLFNEQLLIAMLNLTASDVATDLDATRALSSAFEKPYKPTLSEIFGTQRTPRRPAYGTALLWFDVKEWEQARTWLKLWVPRVRSFNAAPDPDRAEMLAEINRVSFSDRGALKLTPDGLAIEIPHSLVAGCGLALLPFVMPGGWDPARLAQCLYRRCGRWFLLPPPRRGTVAQYCSRTHASNERTERVRTNRAQARAKDLI